MGIEAPRAEETLNGLNPAKLEEVLISLKDPEVLKTTSGPWKSRIVWNGGFRVKAYMRNHVVEMDEPHELAATDKSATAHEQLLSAIGACLSVGFVLNATINRIKIHDMEITLEAHFDTIQKWAGLCETGNPGYRNIIVKLSVKADADEATLLNLWKKAFEGSPVTQSVMRGTPVTLEFQAM
jgi:uncharacterized OsmC-like protein